MECEYGKPQPPYWKDVTNEPTAPVVKKGQYVRVEVTYASPITDDMVSSSCQTLRTYICQVYDTTHTTYGYISNTKSIFEFYPIQDTTLKDLIGEWPLPENVKVYLQELPFWVKYKYPLILGVGAAVSALVYLKVRRRK